MKYDYENEVRVFRQERYDGDWLPEKLSDAIAWLQGMLDSVPAEYRDSAKIEIDSVSSWEDSHYASIEISYRRPPTQAEITERKAKEAERAANDLAWAQKRAADAQRHLDALKPHLRCP
jgi:hypothetical protein